MKTGRTLTGTLLGFALLAASLLTARSDGAEMPSVTAEWKGTPIPSVSVPLPTPYIPSYPGPLPTPVPALDVVPPSQMPPLPDASINPPAPSLASIIRGQTHAELAFTYQGPTPEAFQIMRRVNGRTDLTTVKGAAMLKHSFIAATKLDTWYFTDKKLDPTQSYTYSVLVFTEDGTSLESNSLPSFPPESKTK